tara:strand:- start:319 stop:576 length:258 start_codon:yes stop_codon:yes gene_type:complete
MTTVIYSYNISREAILDPGEIIELFERKGFTFSAIETNFDNTAVNLKFWKPSGIPEISLPRKQYRPVAQEIQAPIVQRCKRQKLS